MLWAPPKICIKTLKNTINLSHAELGYVWNHICITVNEDSHILKQSQYEIKLIIGRLFSFSHLDFVKVIFNEFLIFYSYLVVDIHVCMYVLCIML